MTQATKEVVAVSNANRPDTTVVFEPGESTATVRLSTAADNVNEGDGYIEAGVHEWSSIRHLSGFDQEYAIDDAAGVRVHVHDDDIPELSLSNLSVPATLVGSTWTGAIAEGTVITADFNCGVGIAGPRVPFIHWQRMDHPGAANQFNGFNLTYSEISACNVHERVVRDEKRLFTGPDNGEFTFRLVTPDTAMQVFASNPAALFWPNYGAEGCLAARTDPDRRYCPQWTVGAGSSVHFDVINRNPTITIHAERTYVEEGEPARFIVRRIWNNDQLTVLGFPGSNDTQVFLASTGTTDGVADAQALADAETILFPFGETEITIEIPTIDDRTIVDDQYIVLRLQPDPGGNLNVGGSYETYSNTSGPYRDIAIVDVLDNDAVPIVLTIEPETVAEDGGAQTIEVTATLDGEASEFPVRMLVGVGSGTGGEEDFVPVPEIRLTIAPDTLSVTGSLELTPVDDEVDDDGETLQVVARSGGFRKIVPATLEIVDDDERGVVATPTQIRMYEGEQRSYTVVLATEPTEEVTIRRQLGIHPQKFQVTTTPLVFDATNWSTEQTVTVTALNDADAESHRLALLHEALGGDYTGEIGDTVWVWATDRATRVSVAPASGEAAEAVAEGEAAEFAVTLSSVAAVDVVVDWSTVGDSATAGTDFLAEAAGSVTIPRGETAATVSVSTHQDTLAEADETFMVRLADTSLPAGVTLRTAEADGTIEDDELLTASVAAGAATVSENGTASFPVTLADGTSTAAVEVTYTVTGTATAGTDYTAPSGTLTLAAGEATGTITIAVNGDDVLDPDETLIVTLSDAATEAGAVTVDSAAATTTIEDDGTAKVSVAATAASTVTEGDAAQFTVTLSAASEGATVLAWSTGGGTATAGTDYTEVTSGELTLEAGETSGTLSVTTLPDALAEAAESFTVTIGATTLPEGVTLGTVEATGTIRDDDLLTVGVEAEAPTVSEEGQASFPVTITGGTSTAAVTVAYTVAGTATAGTDYSRPHGTVTLLAGEPGGVLTFEVYADDVLDPGETLVVTLDGATTTLGAAEVDPAPATTTIEDGGMGAVSLAATGASAVTEGEDAEFTVTLSGEAAGDTVLGWSTSAGTATSGTDFTAVTSGTLTIAAGETTGALSVTTVQDTLAEADETFTVTITGATLPTGVTLGTAEATGTIRDDDALTASVEAAATVTEGGTASFPVTIEGGTSAAAVTVTYTVTGEATAGADYTAPSGTLTLAAGDTSGTIAISTLEDDVLDPDETLVVTLTDADTAVGTAAADTTPVTRSWWRRRPRRRLPRAKRRSSR